MGLAKLVRLVPCHVVSREAWVEPKWETLFYPETFESGAPVTYPGEIWESRGLGVLVPAFFIYGSLFVLEKLFSSPYAKKFQQYQWSQNHSERENVEISCP